MLSGKVVCAIDILNILHGRFLEMGGGLKKTEIVALGCVPTQMYGPVLSELSRQRIVERKNSSTYVFSQQPSEVSLLDLVKCIHQGVTLCEYIPTFEFRGAFNYKDHYQSVIRMEKSIQVDLEKQLNNIKLSDLIASNK